MNFKSLGRICVLFISLMASSALSAKSIKVAGKDCPVEMVCPNSPQIKKLGEYLQNFLKERNVEVKQVNIGEKSETHKGAQWILTDMENASFLNEGILSPGFDSTYRDEAYKLIVRNDNSGLKVYIIGKTESGVRAGVSRIICKIANDGNNLWLEEGTELNNPFIKLRLVHIGDSPRRQVPFGSPFKDTDYETWPLSKIRTTPELYWQLGYNGVELAEIRGYSAVPDGDMPRIRRAVQTLAKGAKDVGMYVSLFQWGDCIFKENETLSWNDSLQRKVMRLYMKDLAEDYGTLIDHFIIHVGDPGGCNRDGCDHYRTPQEITNAFYEAFKKVNPRIESTLSTWANGYFWNSCPRMVDRSNYAPFFPDMVNDKTHDLPIAGGARFLDSTFMPSNIGISLHRVYNKDQAEVVLSSKRPLDVWTWYVGDNEMINTFWLNMSEIDRILGSLPKEAGRDIRIYTMEINFHGWPQIINAYVGAQKLWNPNASLKQIEQEFCTGMFGPSNAGAMVDLFNACENGVSSSVPYLPEFGTAAYNKSLKKVLSNSKNIKLAEDWKPNFVLPVAPQKYVDMLVNRLRLIICVSEAKQAVIQARQKRASTARIEEIKRKAIQNIPYIPTDPIYKQDSTIGNDGYRTQTFADMINAL